MAYCIRYFVINLYNLFITPTADYVMCLRKIRRAGYNILYKKSVYILPVNL
jgi:hypothetical protein